MANGGSGSPLAIELSDINKSFGDVHANRNVSLTVVPGHIHGIIGENGAGTVSYTHLTLPTILLV